MEQSVTLERFDASSVVAVMTRDEAAECVREINQHARLLRARVSDLYERRGWEALSYSTWDECCESEFPQWGRTAIWYQVTAAKIERQLVDVHNCEHLSTIPESHLRPLTPLRNDPDLLRDTWEEAHEIAQERGEKFAARHVEEAVKAARPADAPVAFTPAPMAVHFSSATPEHYSPAHIVEMAREVMHAIDLDPASCAQANETVGAAHWYGLDHPNEAYRDGLACVWFGRVWMNPPYGDEIAGWTDRLVHQYAMENVIEGIALVPARTDTAWFTRAAAGRVVCFVTGRLKFGNAENSAPFPSALIYFGEDAETFRAVFGAIGLIATFG